MGSWDRLRALTPGDWRMLITASLLLPVIDIGLRIWGFRRVYAAMGRLSPGPAGSAHSLSDADIDRLVRMVNVAANRGVVRVTCLRRSLAVWWLLRRRGVASEIRIGVRREQGLFMAHAWVERDGLVLNDRADIAQSFVVLASPEFMGGMLWI
jgi:hypothetical protein